MGFLRPLKSFIGMFQGLLGMLVPGQVIFFTVVRGGGAVRVRGEFVEFGSSLVRVVWHGVSLGVQLHLRIIPFSKLSRKGHSPRGHVHTSRATGTFEAALAEPRRALVNGGSLRRELAEGSWLKARVFRARKGELDAGIGLQYILNRQKQQKIGKRT